MYKIIRQNNFNSLAPTIRAQQFSDSFKGFTFIVEKRLKNNIENVFIHDSSNVLKNLTSNKKDNASTTISAKSGLVEEKKMILFNGQIITSKKDNSKNEIIKFEQLNINLENLQPGTITQPKLQEIPRQLSTPNRSLFTSLFLGTSTALLSTN